MPFSFYYSFDSRTIKMGQLREHLGVENIVPRPLSRTWNWWVGRGKTFKNQSAVGEWTQSNAGSEISVNKKENNKEKAHPKEPEWPRRSGPQVFNVIWKVGQAVLDGTNL